MKMTLDIKLTGTDHDNATYESYHYMGARNQAGLRKHFSWPGKDFLEAMRLIDIIRQHTDSLTLRLPDLTGDVRSVLGEKSILESDDLERYEAFLASAMPSWVPFEDASIGYIYSGDGPPLGLMIGRFSVFGKGMFCYEKKCIGWKNPVIERIEVVFAKEARQSQFCAMPRLSIAFYEPLAKHE
jgi:hypothetical protein